MPAWRFREARLQCGLGVEACAELLRISDRTVRNWESGAVRIPYAAYKLMRVLKGGKFLGPEWRDFHVWRGVLHTPEGHRFEAGELSWWSLFVRRARAFSELLAIQTASVARPTQAAAEGGPGVGAPACRPAGQQEEQAADAVCGASNTAHLYRIGTRDTLKPMLRVVVRAWESGADLRAIYPRNTFYRHRRALLPHGIDIAKQTGGVA